MLNNFIETWAILSSMPSIMSQIGGSEMSYLENISEDIRMQSNMS